MRADGRHCNTLQPLQHTATTATFCNTLQHTATWHTCEFGQMEGDCGWYRIGAYGCYHLKVINPLSPQKSNQTYISAKEPCISAKEPCTSATEPWVLSSQGKRPYISVKEPYISSKVPCISAEESIEAYGCYHLKAINPISPQKNPISPQKRPTFRKKSSVYPQKSPNFVKGVCGWCPSTPIDRFRALWRIYRTLFRKCRSLLRRCVAGVA